MGPGPLVSLGIAAVELGIGVVLLAQSRSSPARLPWLTGGCGLVALALGQAVGAVTGGATALSAVVATLLQLGGALATLVAATLAVRTVRRLRSEVASGDAARAELHRSEGRYGFLVAHLPEAFLVLEDGVIRHANEVFVRIFGVAASDAVGKPLELFLAPHSVEAFRARHRVEGTTNSVGVHRLELEIVRPDGDTRWVDMRSQVSNWESRPTEIVLLGDTSRRHRAERRLDELNRALVGLGPDPTASIERIVAACGELLGGDYALYNRLDSGALCAVGAWRAPDGLLAVDRPEGHICYEVICRGQEAGVLAVRDLPRTSYSESDPNVARFGLQTYWGFPVAFGGRTFGSLCVLFRRDVALDEVDSHTLQVLAAAIGREEDRRRAGLALQESEQRYRSLFGSNPLMSMSVGPEGEIREVNQAAVRALGYTAGELIGRSVLDVFNPEDRAVVAAHIRDCVAHPGEVFSWEMRKLRADGSELWVREAAQAAPDPQGSPEVLVVCEDISQQRQAEELQAAIYEISEAAHEVTNLEQLFVSIHRIVGRLMEARNLYIALYDAEENLVSFPHFVDEEDGTPAPRSPGRGLTEYILRTGKPLLATPEVFEELRRLGEVESIGAPSIDWLGVPLIVESQTTGALVVQTYRAGVRYGEREKAILTFVSRQVALAIERKRAEEALRQSEQKYRTLVDNMQEGVVVTRGGKVLFANAMLARLAGMSATDVVGRDLADFIAPEDRPKLLGRSQARGAGAPVPTELEIRGLHSDGVTRADLHVQTSDITYAGKTAVLATVRDLTETKRLESQLRQAQKFEAIGQLAGGVAHDFNNLLMAIVGSTELLRRRLGPGAGDREMDTILRSAQRASELTRGLLAFARRQVLEPVALDLKEVVRQILPILRRVIPENIAIEFQPTEGSTAVRADRGQMDQILMNLAVNARDAMTRGGTITIAVGATTIGEEYVAAHGWGKPGSYVRLAVADTGVGMDEATLPHVFEPFYTTKTRTQGTGLGLAIVYGIVRQHGGMIEAFSQAGQGTRIEILLPADMDVEVTEPSPEPTTTPQGDETVLVVEDEDEVRRILLAALSGLGYQVLEAADGAQALDLLVAGESRVDLVLSDVVMPQMGGRELYTRARRVHPMLPFLFSSGYGDDLTDDDFAGDGIASFLAKPYTIDDLARRVRELLDRARAAVRSE